MEAIRVPPVQGDVTETPAAIGALRAQMDKLPLARPRNIQQAHSRLHPLFFSRLYGRYEHLFVSLKKLSRYFYSFYHVASHGTFLAAVSSVVVCCCAKWYTVV